MKKHFIADFSKKHILGKHFTKNTLSEALLLFSTL